MLPRVNFPCEYPWEKKKSTQERILKSFSVLWLFEFSSIYLRTWKLFNKIDISFVSLFFYLVFQYTHIYIYTYYIVHLFKMLYVTSLYTFIHKDFSCTTPSLCVCMRKEKPFSLDGTSVCEGAKEVSRVKLTYIFQNTKKKKETKRKNCADALV